MNKYLMRFSIPLLALALALGGCAARQGADGDSMNLEQFQSQHSGGEDIEGLNQQILSMAVSTDTADSVYRLGPGDEITMKVFAVDELSGNFRIDGMGRVSLPLIGEVEVSGYTLNEAEEILARRYGEKYLRDPQITISVMEFRSQQFTAMGAVAQPRVYNTQRKITLIEALAMAGGLSDDAGPYVYLTDRIRNPETGQLGVRSLVIGLDDLTEGGAERNVVLGESALLNVPRAGSIFVEGAVVHPGVYQQRGGITVLKAIAMAGGLKFEAKQNQIMVLARVHGSGEWEQQVVAMDEIRESPSADISLKDGDIVVVEASAGKAAWIGLWNGIARIALLGFQPL